MGKYLSDLVLLREDARFEHVPQLPSAYGGAIPRQGGTGMMCTRQRQCHFEATEATRAQSRKEVVCRGVRLLVAFVLVSAYGAHAFGAASPQPDLGCSLTQVSSSTAGTVFDSPSINAAGTRIVFRSTANLTGTNPGGNAE